MSFCPETEEAKHQEYPSLLTPTLFLHDLYTVQKHHLIIFEILKYMYVCVCVWAESLQSCLALCNPVDCNSPGFSVHGILQAIILQWVAIPFSRGSSQPRN